MITQNTLEELKELFDKQVKNATKTHSLGGEQKGPSSVENKFSYGLAFPAIWVMKNEYRNVAHEGFCLGREAHYHPFLIGEFKSTIRLQNGDIIYQVNEI